MLLENVVRTITVESYLEYGAHALDARGQLSFSQSSSMLLISYQMFPCIKDGSSLFTA